jgi:Domain of unknown function (DUF4281)
MKTLSSAFKFATVTALIAWLALFSYPLWPQTARAVVFTVVVLLLSAMYGYFLFFAKHLDEPGQKVKGNFSSLAGVMRLFTSPRAVLAGWIHYLAFDLMVGLYIVIDAQRVGITHWWLLPALFLTLMFGPVGLLVYLVMRFFIVGVVLLA